MRYGLNLPAAGPSGDARTLAELAVAAEETGWDGLFLEDYIVYQNRQDIPTYDPWIALAAIAMRTQRIRIGTEVTPLARRRPWKLARECVTVDHLSGGRFQLSVGLGVSTDIDFAHLDEDQDGRRRASRLDEALEVLVGLWSGNPFSYAGRHFNLRETTFLPTPVQKPRIPIWIGGGYPNRGPLERAARWDGACFYRAAAPGSSLDAGRLDADAVRGVKKFVDSRGGDTTGFEIIVGAHERAADWEEERNVIQSVANAGATWWIEWVPAREPDVMRRAIENGPLRI
jgi:alkanesulfonate monooxygenase SsuD/methylene tetrahydromethanopterin reductase-like flavin-dependent oxidoreductase (luciferase family)